LPFSIFVINITNIWREERGRKGDGVGVGSRGGDRTLARRAYIPFFFFFFSYSGRVAAYKVRKVTNYRSRPLRKLWLPEDAPSEDPDNAI
jgi:hypothetical protein